MPASVKIAEAATSFALAASAAATAEVRPSSAQLSAMDEQDYFLTQTQPLASPPAAVQHDQGIYARLVSLTVVGYKYELKRDQKQVRMGRHPDCEIVIVEKRVSAFHLRIYRDDAFRYFVEELSSNGCYINDHFMKKGENKSLQHGDEISIGVSGDSINSKETLAAYIFRIADCENDSLPQPCDVASTAVVAEAGSTREIPSAEAANVLMAGPGNSHYVTEQWVRSNWDTRTVLGSGNFSEVRLGVHVQRGEQRAVKIIDKKKFIQFQSKRNSHLTLRSEADVLLKLSHSGILGFYEWFETDMHLYLVTEFLQGGDLLQCILEHGCFTENMARRLFRDLCDAVKYLHTNSIVHRDLKPENILLTTKDRNTTQLKIADFGLARSNHQSNDCKTFCGTPHYFAPEVINTFRDGDSTESGYGKQADMWSLGVILYIMLSGIPPFEEEGLYEQILEGKFEFDVREWTVVSKEAKDLVKQLMTVNPKDRLTIDQACRHRWLQFEVPSSCPSPPRSFKGNLPPTFCPEVQPMQVVVEGEPVTKRRRTVDGPMHQVTEHSPLGA